MLTEDSSLQSIAFKSSVVLQMTLDQDYLVPEHKADIEKIIVVNGEIQVQSIKRMTDKMLLKGVLSWRMLYLKDRQSCVPDHMEGEMPFEEVVNMDGVTESTDIHVDCETEDLRATMINSRKISIRSVVNMQVRALVMEEIQAISGLTEPLETVCMQKKNVTVSHLAVTKKDMIRIREEMELPGNKANITEIVWGDIQNRHVDIRPMDDKLLLRGEAAVFLLYSGENEENAFEYAEAELPWHTEVPCDGMREAMILNCRLHKISQTLEMKADMDGEMRIIMVEMALEIDMMAYEEKEQPLITDIYSVNRLLIPVMQEVTSVHMLMHNQTECKLYDKVRMPGEYTGILQLCHPWAEIRMDRLEMTKEGIKAEGAADVHLLYVNGDDQQPLDVMHAGIPFACTIETGKLPENVRFEAYPLLDHISAVMMGQNTAEVRMTVRLDTMIFEPIHVRVVTAIDEQEADDSYMEALPNMTGYVVQQGDCLFSVGKKFCTTVDMIKNVNHLEKDEITEGERLLIMKHYK